MGVGKMQHRPKSAALTDQAEMTAITGLFLLLQV